jgi:hypothetical protein
VNRHTVPPGHDFGAGVTEDALREAVARSGYPLQGVAVDTITSRLRRACPDANEWATRVQEEWSFMDLDEGKVRNLDALIVHDLTPHDVVTDYGHILEPAGSFRHHLVFLVECKQSMLPFVFFLRNADAGKVPRVVGWPHPEIDVEVRGDRGGDGFHYFMTASDAFDLGEFRHCPDAPVAIGMRHVERRGKKVELSGDEVFRELSLPLSKALGHYRESVEGRPRPGALYHDLHHVHTVVVLRAPMVGITSEGDDFTSEHLSVVRLVRVEPGSEQRFGSSAISTTDVVHIDALDEYVSEVVAEAQLVVARVNENAVCLLTGEGVSRLTTTDLAQTEDRLDESGEDQDFPCAKMSDEAFLESWWDRFRAVHSQQAAGETTSDDGAAPQT